MKQQAAGNHEAQEQSGQTKAQGEQAQGAQEDAPGNGEHRAEIQSWNCPRCGAGLSIEGYITPCPECQATVQVESGSLGLTLREWSPDELSDLTMIDGVAIDYDPDSDAEADSLIDPDGRYHGECPRCRLPLSVPDNNWYCCPACGAMFHLERWRDGWRWPLCLQGEGVPSPVPSARLEQVW